MLLSLAQSQFLKHCAVRDLSPKTRLRYQHDLDRLSRFLSHRELLYLEEASTETLRDFFAQLLTRDNQNHRGRKLSPFTVEGIHRSIHTFFQFCYTERYITSNPMDRVPKNKLPKRLVPRLSEDQVAELLQAVRHTQSPQRNMALVALLIDSGLRRGEALAIKLEDVNLTEEKVTVLGKGQKEREIPLGKASTRALRTWLKIRPNSNGYENVFVKKDGTPFQAEGLRSLLNRIKRHLGLKRLYPHLLRHSFAKLFLLYVHDAKALQQVLGHSRASTTLDLYVHYDFNDLKKIYRRGSPLDAINRKAKKKNRS